MNNIKVILNFNISIKTFKEVLSFLKQKTIFFLLKLFVAK